MAANDPPTSHVRRLPQALIHFVCSRWPGSDGRKVEMRLLGKWFTPDVAWALGRKPPERPKPLISFASPVRLKLREDFPNGAASPSVDTVLAWSKLLSLLCEMLLFP